MAGTASAFQLRALVSRSQSPLARCRRMVCLRTSSSSCTPSQLAKGSLLRCRAVTVQHSIAAYQQLLRVLYVHFRLEVLQQRIQSVAFHFTVCYGAAFGGVSTSQHNRMHAFLYPCFGKSPGTSEACPYLEQLSTLEIGKCLPKRRQLARRTVVLPKGGQR